MNVRGVATGNEIVTVRVGRTITWSGRVSVSVTMTVRGSGSGTTTGPVSASGRLTNATTGRRSGPIGTGTTEIGTAMSAPASGRLANGKCAPGTIANRAVCDTNFVVRVVNLNESMAVK